MPSAIVAAFRAWQKTQPESNKHGCCLVGHWRAGGFHGKDTPRADEDVCVRERRWREYVRLRDSDPTFMKGPMVLI